VQENREYDPLDYAAQHVAPGPDRPDRAAFRPPFVHRPSRGQIRGDNLQRLARRLLYHPGSRVNRVWMEPGAAQAGRFEVVIFLEASDVL